MLKKLAEGNPEAAQKIYAAQEKLPDKPVDIVALAVEFGLGVYTAQLQLGVSGQIARDAKLGGESGYYIAVDSDEPKQRQRFTIAHEIAHFLLHKNQVGDGLTDSQLYRSRLSNKSEVEANKLAADILMPHDKIDMLIEQIGKHDISFEIIAKRFDISLSALRVRLGII